MKIEQLEKRIDNIEAKLDVIANNHLSHIEKYTKWTLIGIMCSVVVSVGAIVATIGGI